MLFYHASFFFFLIIDLYLLIPAVIAQIVNLIAEPIISIKKYQYKIGITIKKVKSESEIHPVIVEAKIRKCSI